MFFNFNSLSKIKGKGIFFPLILIILLPLINESLNIIPRLPIAEKRNLAKKPTLNIQKPFLFLSDFGAYFNDHFNLRNYLIYANNYFKIRVLNSSPSKRILLANGEWMFLAQETPTRNQIDYYRSRQLFSLTELDQWYQVLKQRRDWFQKRGIVYLLLIAPSKMTIYPEKMPKSITKVYTLSRLDQLSDYLNKKGLNCLVDVRKELLVAKEEYPVYFKTGSHWNQYGAYIAYSALFKKLNAIPSLVDLPVGPSYQFRIQDVPGNDFPQMLGLQDLIRDIQVQVLANQRPDAHLGPFSYISKNIQHSYSSCPGKKGFKAILVHDSFIGGFKRLFAEHFERVDYFWDYQKKVQLKTVQTQKPHIYIDEMGERFLLDTVLKNPPEMVDDI